MSGVVDPRPDEGAHEEAPPISRGGADVALRLAIGKDGLGIELARKASLACIDVVELVVRLPQVRFPFDVTGGIAKFRNRRGELERLGVELDGRRIARFAAPRLRGLLRTGPCDVTVTPRAYGATVAVVARATDEPEAAETRALSVLAFELALVPRHADVTLVVYGARGAHLAAPATLLALRATAAIVGDAATREGCRFVVEGAAERLGRHLLPDAGVRAPSGDDVVVVGSGESDGVLFVALARQGAVAAIPEEATLANEAALLLREADDALVAGQLDRAREANLGVLERAPRHPEIARRIAEIDAHVGGRADAAAATLRAAEGGKRVGLLLGELLVQAGDVDGALAALLREAERETSGPVAAAIFARAAELARDPVDALAWLDRAVAHAPTFAEHRWERAERRLAAGRLADARADFQELEALARGPRRRHVVLRRAGDLHRRAGLGADAALAYERALLYRPDDPDTVAGLGAAIAAEGRASRGAALLASAIDTAAARALPTAWMELALAKVLAEQLGDRPAAIARVRAIPDEDPLAIEARAREGRYRAELGDVAGAALAFARLRERAGHEPTAVPWLAEAATFDEARGDLAGAQRHLAVALAIAPHDASLADRYRAIGHALVRQAPPVVTLAQAAPPAQPTDFVPAQPTDFVPANPTEFVPAQPTDFVLEVGGRAAQMDARAAQMDPSAREERIEALTRTLQGDPTNDGVVDELVLHLTALGRGMELLALLSARLEDAPAERRAELLPKHHAVLADLEAHARAEGRDGEADLFKMARELAG